MPNHSPAPWKIGAEFSNSQDEIEDANGRTVAVVWTRKAPMFTASRPCFKDVEEWKGNLQLMAASPQLLAALQHMLNRFENMCRNNPATTPTQKTGRKICIEDARNAIAQATGPQS